MSWRVTATSLATFAIEQPDGELVPTLDVTRKVARLVLDGRPARRVGPDGDQRARLARLVDDIGIVLCAESVGACDRALTMASDYAKQRVQFDRPIATFQAIKHKIVDMLHQLELARSLPTTPLGRAWSTIRSVKALPRRPRASWPRLRR